MRRFIVFGVGTGEIVLIAILALVLFGPVRMLEVARTLGRATQEVRRAMNEVRTEIDSAGDGPGDDRSNTE